MNLTEDFIAAIEAATGRHGVRRGHETILLCPAHDDHEPSLSVREGANTAPLVTCRSHGCSFNQVCAALGSEPREYLPARADDEQWTPHGTAVARYDYNDADGRLRFQVCRTADKQFPARRPDPSAKSGWRWNLNGIERVLYRLPVVLTARRNTPDAPIYVAEGEKDVDALEAAGCVATCNPGGAGKWQDSYAEPLRGARVIIVADRDEPGRQHAAAVAASLAGVAAQVVIVEARTGKDAADHLAAGFSLDEFAPLADEAAAAEPAAVLDEIVRFVRRFVVVTAEQADALALWTAHTHAIDAADGTPYIAITSAVKRSGKTRLLEVLELLVHEPLLTANISDAALFRAIGELGPTLLFDEVDAIFGAKAREREDLRGLLNAGHRRGAVARRMGGPKMTTLETFSVFCAKAFAGIGDALPDTIIDRAIVIRLQRRTRDEHVERFRRREVQPEAETLRNQVAKALAPWIDALRSARPSLPDELDDRAQDVWEPLLAVADLAGANWPQRARAAAHALSTGEEREDDSLTARLLADIASVFEESGEDRIRTSVLLERLAALEDSPWGDWHGRPLTAHGLSRLLRSYRIKTMPVRVDGETVRGYKAEQFADAWRRVVGVTHVTPVTPGTAPDAAGNACNAESAIVGKKPVTARGQCGQVAVTKTSIATSRSTAASAARDAPDSAGSCLPASATAPTMLVSS